MYHFTLTHTLGPRYVDTYTYMYYKAIQEFLYVMKPHFESQWWHTNITAAAASAASNKDGSMTTPLCFSAAVRVSPLAHHCAETLHRRHHCCHFRASLCLCISISLCYWKHTMNMGSRICTTTYLTKSKQNVILTSCDVFPLNPSLWVHRKSFCCKGVHIYRRLAVAHVPRTTRR